MKLKSALATFATAAALGVSAPGYATDWASFDCGADWGPTKASAPTYPRRALQKGIEGSIVMSFNVSPTGEVTDVRVSETTGNAFIRSATNAVESYEFPPCVTNGLARTVEDVSVRYEFNLEG